MREKAGSQFSHTYLLIFTNVRADVISYVCVCQDLHSVQ